MSCDLPTWDLPLYFKEAGSYKEIIFLPYLWVSLNIMDCKEKKVTPGSEYLQTGLSDFSLTYNNWGYTPIIYVPRDNGVTHHLARSSDKASFIDDCEFTDIQDTRSHQRHKPNPIMQRSLREPNSQFSVTLHSLGVLIPQFRAISQLHIFIFCESSMARRAPLGWLHQASSLFNGPKKELNYLVLGSKIFLFGSTVISSKSSWLMTTFCCGG